VCSFSSDEFAHLVWLECFIPRDLTNAERAIPFPLTWLIFGGESKCPQLSRSARAYALSAVERLALVRLVDSRVIPFGFGAAAQTLCNPPVGKRPACFDDGRKQVNDHAVVGCSRTTLDYSNAGENDLLW
jgi:hypothetical protein